MNDYAHCSLAEYPTNDPQRWLSERPNPATKEEDWPSEGELLPSQSEDILAVQLGRLYNICVTLSKAKLGSVLKAKNVVNGPIGKQTVNWR
jgi:hypothetical protein